MQPFSCVQKSAADDEQHDRQEDRLAASVGNPRGGANMAAASRRQGSLDLCKLQKRVRVS